MKLSEISRSLKKILDDESEGRTGTEAMRDELAGLLGDINLAEKRTSRKAGIIEERAIKDSPNGYELWAVYPDFYEAERIRTEYGDPTDIVKKVMGFDKVHALYAMEA